MSPKITNSSSPCLHYLVFTVEADLEELSVFSLESYTKWDSAEFLKQNWCSFSPSLAASHLGLEVFALAQAQGYGAPLEYSYKFDSNSRVVKANFLFRRIGRHQEWLEDFLFYGRGKLPKGHRWVDHCRVEIAYLTPPAPVILRCKTASGIEYKEVKDRYISTARFWYSAVFKTELPSKSLRKSMCDSECKICWHPEDNHVIPNYVINTSYDPQGQNISERHFTTPESTFTARPSKYWLGGVQFNKVTGRKFENSPKTDRRYEKFGIRRGADFSEYRPPSNNKVPQFIYDSTSSEEEYEDVLRDSDSESLSFSLSDTSIEQESV